MQALLSGVQSPIRLLRNLYFCELFSTVRIHLFDIALLSLCRTRGMFSSFVNIPRAPRIQPPERHEKIVKLREDIMDELYPRARSDPVNDAV